ncbi:FKBP-type peptidyl-prolyl cis-trans isomerase [Nocardioides sp. LHG3406-4]|uniref:FKBP-type peptidyl-prolyl cis-trans isomerase n=1 Tax=Nocardioides sp. LHG3406-4 TaxID=2804575 RepID=UPI003CEBB94E
MSRRVLAVPAALLLAALTLSACGNDSGEGSGSSSGSGAGLSVVKVSGDQGKAPKVTFDEKLDPSKVETKVITEGDGEEIADGDNVLTHVWIGNGFTEKQAFTTYDAGTPELLNVNDQLTPALKKGIEGQTVGSRVAVAAPAGDAFSPEQGAQLGLGNQDSVLFVLDLVEKIGTEPKGEEKPVAKWAPAITDDDGTITGLDFSKAPEPGDNLLITKTVKGDGAVVKKGQTIYVNYLGQTYKGDKPFDESYSAGSPVSFPIGVGQVIKGWDDALVGQTVGSRMILAIPPDLGYGAQGNKDAGIKGTDTLYFVVDILAAV